MDTWSLHDTRNFVRHRFGVEQVELATQSLGSTIDRLEYARFHYHEVRELIETRIKPLQKSQRLLIAMMGAEHNEQQRRYDEARANVGAHVVACIQSLHAISDILAHAVYYSLGLNLQVDALSELQIAAGTVTVKLKANPNYLSLATSLEKLSSHEHSEYLKALTNQSKHRSLVKSVLWLDMTQEATKPMSLQFEDFSRGGKPYERREILPFLEGTFNQVSKIVIDTGVELNVVLRAELV